MKATKNGEPETVARRELQRRWDDREWMMRALTEATRAAVEDHIAAGNSVAAWRDGRTVLLSPEEARRELEVDAASGASEEGPD